MIKIREWHLKTEDGQKATFITTINASKKIIDRKARALCKGKYTIEAGKTTMVRE